MVAIPLDFHPNETKLQQQWAATTTYSTTEDRFCDGGEDRYGSGHEMEMENFKLGPVMMRGYRFEAAPFTYLYPEILW
jgi:hypothetical protein